MFFFLRKDLYAAVFVGLLLGFPATLACLEPSAETFGFLLISISSLTVCSESCRTADYGYFAGLSNLARKYGVGFAQVTLIYLLPLFAILHGYCTVVSLIGLWRGKAFTEHAWKWITEAPAFNVPEQAITA